MLKSEVIKGVRREATVHFQGIVLEAVRKKDFLLSTELYENAIILNEVTSEMEERMNEIDKGFYNSLRKVSLYIQKYKRRQDLYFIYEELLPYVYPNLPINELNDMVTHYMYVDYEAIYRITKGKSEPVFILDEKLPSEMRILAINQLLKEVFL